MYTRRPNRLLSRRETLNWPYLGIRPHLSVREESLRLPPCGCHHMDPVMATLIKEKEAESVRSIQPCRMIGRE